LRVILAQIPDRILLFLDTIVALMMDYATFSSTAVLKTEFQQAASIRPSMWVSDLWALLLSKTYSPFLHKFLESAKFSGHPAVLHLVIVAATTPTEDDNGAPFSGNGYSPWLFLAQKLAKVI
jgi:hypothetical protein